MGIIHTHDTRLTAIMAHRIVVTISITVAVVATIVAIAGGTNAVIGDQVVKFEWCQLRSGFEEILAHPTEDIRLPVLQRFDIQTGERPAAVGIRVEANCGA